jgi:hypothetical protein
MYRLLAVTCAFIGCLLVNIGAGGLAFGGETQAPLTHTECVRLVRRELVGPSFSESSPMAASFIASCSEGRDFYNRTLFDCMFSAKYINPLDCMYRVRGKGRSEQSPDLASRTVVGDDGGYEAYVSGVAKSIYQGQDPHTTIDPQLRKRYLTQRNNVILSLGEVPPGDDNAPSQIAASQIDVGGRAYWTVHENFTDLQLLKIMREDNVGTETVFCARFGSAQVLRTDEGLCAFLIKKHWSMVLPD